jgi:uncharacterized protein (DUF983 family)
MPQGLNAVEIERVRRIQIGLRTQRVCADCGESRLVAEFREYGWPTCTPCEVAVAEVLEQARMKAIAAAEAAERERIAATVCPECGRGKLTQLPRCTWCHRQLRAAAVASARESVRA